VLKATQAEVQPVHQAVGGVLLSGALEIRISMDETDAGCESG